MSEKKQEPFVVIEEVDLKEDELFEHGYIRPAVGMAGIKKSQYPFRVYNDPKSINELLEIEGMVDLLGGSIVFIQNRKDSSSHLINKKLQKIYKYVDCVEVSPKYLLKIRISIKIEKIIKNIFQRLQIERENKNKIIIIEANNNSDILRISKVATRIKNSSNGIWIRGYIWELNPYILSLFDAIFVFDMSRNEFEILRSTIDISENTIDNMKNSEKRDDFDQNILFFLNRDNFIDCPLLLKNPILFDN